MLNKALNYINNIGIECSARPSGRVFRSRALVISDARLRLTSVAGPLQAFSRVKVQFNDFDVSENGNRYILTCSFIRGYNYPEDRWVENLKPLEEAQVQVNSLFLDEFKRLLNGQGFVLISHNKAYSRAIIKRLYKKSKRAS